MQSKHITILSIVFVIVGIISVFLLTRTPFEGGGTDTLGLEAIRGDEVTEVRKTDSVRTVTLVREGEMWRFDGEEIEGAQVTALLSSLALARATQVARDGRGVASYGFSSVQTVTFKSERTTVAFDVGGAGPTAGSVYVALPDAPEVYLLEGTTLGDVARADWTTWVKEGVQDMEGDEVDKG